MYESQRMAEGHDSTNHETLNIIPEPGTLAFLLLGGVAVLTRRRRRA
ncbi:MAG: PEP-CTERM sorting domain-containing protein [Verrucomicrobiota bacterium]